VLVLGLVELLVLELVELQGDATHLVLAPQLFTMYQ